MTNPLNWKKIETTHIKICKIQLKHCWEKKLLALNSYMKGGKCQSSETPLQEHKKKGLSYNNTNWWETPPNIHGHRV